MLIRAAAINYTPYWLICRLFCFFLNAVINTSIQLTVRHKWKMLKPNWSLDNLFCLTDSPSPFFFLEGHGQPSPADTAQEVVDALDRSPINHRAKPLTLTSTSTGNSELLVELACSSLVWIYSSRKTEIGTGHTSISHLHFHSAPRSFYCSW